MDHRVDSRVAGAAAPLKRLTGSGLSGARDSGGVTPPAGDSQRGGETVCTGFHADGKFAVHGCRQVEASRDRQYLRSVTLPIVDNVTTDDGSELPQQVMQSSSVSVGGWVSNLPSVSIFIVLFLKC